MLSVVMLNVANNPFMLSVVMLNVIMLSVLVPILNSEAHVMNKSSSLADTFSLTQIITVLMSIYSN